MSFPIFYLDVDIEGCDAGVYLNRAPILAANQAQPSRVARTVSEWLVAGSNEIAIAVFSASEQVGGTAHARARLCRGMAGELADPERDALAEVAWSRPVDRDARFPEQVRTAVDASHPWGAWRWQSAPEIAGDTGTRAEVVTAVKMIRSSLAQGNARMFLSASQTKLEEVGRCYGMDPPAARARFRSVWREVIATPGFSLAEIDEDALVVQRFCDNRLAVPLTPDGRPSLREGTDDGSGWSMPIFFARLDGLLAVVR